MKYLTAITSLIIINLLAIAFLLYFGNLTRLIEEQNDKLSKKITLLENQLKINEVEYTMHNNYSYLKKLKNIYFESEDKIFSNNNRLTLKDFKNKGLQNVYKVSSN